MAPPVRHRFRLALVVAIYAGLVLGGGFIGGWISHSLDITIWPHTEPLFHRVITTALFAYIFLTAFPFVPGIEVGMALILTFGPGIVPILYLATVSSLTLSFIVGRLVPERWLAAAFNKLGMQKAERLVREIMSKNTEERLAYIVRSSPQKWIPWLLKHRILALAVLINLPGNALIGGGGGICMMVGMSRLLALPKFVLAVALGVSPVPLMIALTSTVGG